MRVNLKIEGEQTQVDVSPINVFQLTESLKIIQRILDVLKKEGQLVGFIDQLMSAESDETMTDEQRDKMLIANLAGSFDTLLIVVPELAVELIAKVSGIKLQDMQQQEVETLFDVLDAIVNVNDIERIVERAKKFFAVTKLKWAGKFTIGKK
ncbi:hypothetical protein [Bacillus phage vB_BceS-M2]